MHDAGDLGLVLRLDGQAVAAVPHGDHRVLQVVAVLQQKGIQLVVDAVGNGAELSPHLGKAGARAVGDLLLGENVGFQLAAQGIGRLQAFKTLGQGVRRRIAVGLPVNFRAVGHLQDLHDPQKLDDA